MICFLKQNTQDAKQSIKLDRLILAYDVAIACLVHEHLPFVRRFAARNVGQGEDPEDVFQIAFMGLQRSTTRFKSERGDRFITYCSIWMQQALTKWRADDSALVRVPAHRYQNLAMLDCLLSKLDVQTESVVPDNVLAAQLGWTTNQVRELCKIPHNAEYPESLDDWDEILPPKEDEDTFDSDETVSIVMDALAELDSREADVIKMRFGRGSSEEMTLDGVGRYYGLTRERIRQIELKALRRLSLPERKISLKKLLGII